VIIVALTIILLILAIVFGSLGIIKEIGNLSSNKSQTKPGEFFQFHRLTIHSLD